MTGSARRLTRLVLIAVPIAIVAAGCGGGGGATTSDVPQLRGAQTKDAGLVEGQKVWAANCTRCHGLNGQGGIGPKLAGKVTGDFPNIDDEIKLVADGKGIMPPWKDNLTPAQIRAVVRYTREVL